MGSHPHQHLCRTLLALVTAGLGACASAPSADSGLTQIPLTAGTPVPGSPGAAAATPAAPRAAAYTLAVGDEIDIRLLDAPQYDQTARIGPDGKVNLNLIGTLSVAGRSAEEVQRELRERYAALGGRGQDRDYLIHVNDELEFKFPYHQQLNDQMRIRPDGKVQLQLVGTVQAEGLTPEELQAELLRRYSKYLKDTDVTVIVRTATSRMVRTAQGEAVGGLADLNPSVVLRSFQTPQVYVTGEVARPGMVAYTPGLTLLQVLAESGGTLPSGDIRKLVILRRTDAETAAVLRPGLTKTYRAAPTRDLVLAPYDVLLVPPTRAQSLAETLDAYVYKLFAPLKNSTFGYVFGATKVY
jgi:polysaccharide export outer membrane protein